MLLEIFADFVCPWCYIGRRRLARALEARPEQLIRRRWLSFQLNPEMPAGGMDRNLYYAAKFGSVERAKHLHAMVEETAAREQLPLALDRVRRVPNTFEAHRLLRCAERHGLGEAMVDAFFHAYFVEGHDLGDEEVLRYTAVGIGMSAEAIQLYFDDPDYEADSVRASEALARQMGVQAVPCYVFNRRYALAGAQEPAAFYPMLDLALVDQGDPAVSY